MKLKIIHGKFNRISKANIALKVIIIRDRGVMT